MAYMASAIDEWHLKDGVLSAALLALLVVLLAVNLLDESFEVSYERALEADMREAFDSCDRNGDGILELREFSQLLNSMLNSMAMAAHSGDGDGDDAAAGAPAAA